MHKIAVVGNKSIIGFKVLGIDVIIVDDKRDAHSVITKLIEKDYAVIFVTEKVAEGATALIDLYNSKPVPIITVIPDNTGSTGIAISKIQGAVEKAVGSFINTGEHTEEE